MNGGGSIFPTPYSGQDLALVELWTNRFWDPYDFTYVIFNCFKCLKSIISLYMSNLINKFGYRSKNKYYIYLFKLHITPIWVKQLQFYN